MSTPSTQKRRIPPKVAAMKARKRQKLDQAVDPSVSKLPVRLNELPWTDVRIPERMNDYEGLFGLEELADVEVVKDSETGNVSFAMAKSKIRDKGRKEAASINGKEKGREGSKHPTSAEDAGAESDAESWAGFSEVDEAETSLRVKTVPEAQKQDGVKSKHSKKATSKPLLSSTKSAFEVLQDEVLDEDADTSAWEGLGLSSELLAALSHLKFATPTPIQTAAIPRILEGHDVIGKASTGSGKTLAFGLPVIQSFLEQKSAMTREASKRAGPMALIISPTRELAIQISNHLKALCEAGSFENPAITAVTGGLSVQKQMRLLEHADVVVATPGRLWEVMSSGQGLIKRVQGVRFIILDEADRLLSEGHFKDLEEILNIFTRVDEEPDQLDQKNQAQEQQQEDAVCNKTNPDRQTLVFSATFHRDLQRKLAGKAKGGGDLMSAKESLEYLLRKLPFREKPKFIDCNPVSQMASGLREGIIEAPGVEKDLFLYTLLLYYPNTRTLVFTNSISAVRRVVPFLQYLNLPALALHSQMDQKARLRSVERFRERKGSILVATDVAARGIDIENVQLVVHYHLPRTADAYVHRSGRTARAGSSGSSVLICAPEEVAGVRRLVAKVHAQAASSDTPKKAYMIRSLDIDRRIVSRLKPRATLAKKLADTTIAKEKKHSEEDWMKQAAEDLGVDYDSDELEAEAPGRRGRGAGRRKREKEARELTKTDIAAIKAQLKELLSQKINVGVSERYLTNGGVDVGGLLKGEARGDFLGPVHGLGFDEED